MKQFNSNVYFFRTTSRPSFKPNSNEKSEESEDESDLENSKVSTLLDRRSQLFKSRVRLPSRQPVVVLDSEENSSNTEVAQALRSRFQRLRRPKAEATEEAQETPEEDSITKKNESVRCKILKRGCDDENER